MHENYVRLAHQPPPESPQHQFLMWYMCLLVHQWWGRQWHPVSSTLQLHVLNFRAWTYLYQPLLCELNWTQPSTMPHGQGFTTKIVGLGGSQGIIICHLGHWRHSPSHVSEGRPHFQPGIQRISNAQLPMQRAIDNQVHQTELQGKWQYYLMHFYSVSL